MAHSLFCVLVAIIGVWPLRAQITEYPAPFNGLSGIAAGLNGAMWFSGDGNIGRITTAGVVTAYPIPTPNVDSISITAGPDGAVWFTETYLYAGGNFAKIGQITTGGVITEYPRSACDAQMGHTRDQHPKGKCACDCVEFREVSQLAFVIYDFRHTFEECRLRRWPRSRDMRTFGA